MSIYLRCFATALVGALLLTGCNKFPTSGSEEKVAAEPTQGSSAASQDEAPSAASIAQDLSAGNYENAAKGAQAAIDADLGNAELLLLLARAQAKLQNVGEAVKALKTSFDAGFHDPRGALNNPDFDGIRANPIFLEFANKFQRKQVGIANRSRSGSASSITAGDVSITGGRDGQSHIRAGDIQLDD